MMELKRKVIYPSEWLAWQRRLIQEWYKEKVKEWVLMVNLIKAHPLSKDKGCATFVVYQSILTVVADRIDTFD